MNQHLRALLLVCSALFCSQSLATTYVPILFGDIMIIIPVNHPPQAQPDSFSLEEDTPTVLNVLANDIDENLDTVSVTIVQQTENGALLLASDNRTLTYTPHQDFHGADRFTYHLTDEKQQTSQTVSVDIQVLPVNDAPVATEDIYAFDEDAPLRNLPLLSNDSDVEGGPLTLEIVEVNALSAFKGRTLTLASDSRSVYYQPPANANGEDWFTYVARDAEGGVSSPVSVTLSIAPKNDAPVVSDMNLVTDEDEALVITPVASDIDGDSLSFSIVRDPTPFKGRLSVEGATIRFSPYKNLNGHTSFTYVANDGTVSSAPATVNIYINPVNDGPQVQGATPTYATNEDQSVILDLNGKIIDPEGDAFWITRASGGNLPQGRVKILGEGKLEYTPPRNFSGLEHIAVWASDSQVETISVAHVNVAPVPDDTVVSAAIIQGDYVYKIRFLYFSPDGPIKSASFSVTAHDEREGHSVPEKALVFDRDKWKADNSIVEKDADIVTGKPLGARGRHTLVFKGEDFNGRPFQWETDFTFDFDSNLNVAPVTQDDLNFIVAAGQTTELDVLLNDYDPDGDRLTIAAADSLNGEISLTSKDNVERLQKETGADGEDLYAGMASVMSNASVTITPGRKLSLNTDRNCLLDYNLTGSYTADDGEGGQSTAQFRVEVICEPDPTPPEPVWNLGVNKSDFWVNDGIELTWRSANVTNHRLVIAPVSGSAYSRNYFTNSARQQATVRIPSPGTYSVSVLTCNASGICAGGSHSSVEVRVAEKVLDVENLQLSVSKINPGMQPVLRWGANELLVFNVSRRFNNGSYVAIASHIARDHLRPGPFTEADIGTYRYRVQACDAGNVTDCGTAVTSEPLIVTDEPVPVELKYRYDALGRLVAVEDPMNGGRHYDLDDAGNRTSVSKEQ